jgi:hypothetical protein
MPNLSALAASSLAFFACSSADSEASVVPCNEGGEGLHGSR